MLKTIILGAATLVVAMNMAWAADGRDLNQDGTIQAWEVHEFYGDFDYRS